ncbi:MAG TPA: DNRLRE domain-containing protein [Kofleriaceae bacterium]
MRRGLAACCALACIVLAGCDGVFGLQHIASRDAGPNDVGDRPIDGRIDAPVDTSCGPATGLMTTKRFGGRLDSDAPSSATDTFIVDDVNHLGRNWGALERIFVCRHCMCTSCEGIAGGDDDAFGLLRFDLSTQIPACSTVQSATLHLHTNSDNLGTGSVVAYQVLEAWDEGTGDLFDGEIGAANWTNRQLNNPWINAGADEPSSRGTAILASFSPNVTETNYPTTLSKAIVQSWVDNPGTNHGLVLVIEGSMSDVHFYSTESAMPNKRPALEVTYQAP